MSDFVSFKYHFVVVAMDFTYTEFPSTVNFNTFKAYFNLSEVILPKTHDKSLTTPVQQANEATTTNSNINQPKSLRHSVLETIASNWNGK